MHNNQEFGQLFMKMMSIFFMTNYKITNRLCVFFGQIGFTQNIFQYNRFHTFISLGESQRCHCENRVTYSLFSITCKIFLKKTTGKKQQTKKQSDKTLKCLNPRVFQKFDVISNSTRPPISKYSPNE